MIHRWIFSARDSDDTDAQETPSKTEAAALAEDDDVFNEPELLDRLMNDRDLVRTVLAGFLDDIPIQFGKLKEFLCNGDNSGAQRQAHTIKGAAANLGAPPFDKWRLNWNRWGKRANWEMPWRRCLVWKSNSNG